MLGDFFKKKIDFLFSTLKFFLLHLSKLQVLSFMFVPNCRRYLLSLNLTSFVLNVSKSCTLCPLALTQLDF
ncbi:hypothetical protein Hanom_Chr16g01465561 [Helianthus anomalus]